MLAAESVSEEWTMYLNGSIFCYTIKDDKGNFVDSCCGIYGYHEAKKQAQEVIAFHETMDREEACPLDLVYN